MPDRSRTAVRAASSAAVAAAALAALAGCSSGGTGGAADAAALAKATGTWTATGDYQTPGGQESVKVTLTAKDGTVTDVGVTGSGTTPNSRQYQAQFISGIRSAVVGKSLATLEVGAVSGSSLTGQGFDAAVAQIRTDAA